MLLHSNRLTLTKISIEHLDAVHQLHSFPEVDQFNTLGIPHSRDITNNLVLQWTAQQSAVPQTSFVFVVSLKNTSEFIGLIALNLGKPNYRIAEVWYKTHPHFWKNGYTTEALKTSLQFGFIQLKLHRIEAGCAVENTASIRVLEKAGMVREGRKRQILPIRGEWVDNYFYAILENDFLLANKNEL